MKFLIISTYYKCGGAELQALFERDILESNGHEVLYLTFDPALKSGESCDDRHLNLIGGYSTFISRIERIIVSPFIIAKVRRIVSREKPDVVHFHNITFAFNSIAIAVKDIFSIQTMHDYSYVCSKNLKCIRDDNDVCEDCCKSECIKNCYNNGLRDWLLFNYKYFVRKKSQWIRIKTVDKIISPSKCLTGYLNRYGYSAITINNAISVTNFIELKKSLDIEKKRKVIMLGSVSARKGIIQFLDAFSAYEYPNIRFEIIGGIGDDIDEKLFYELVGKAGATYLGIKDYPEVVKALEDTYALVIPSLWMENYPNVALEGMISDCIVFGSNRGGIPEMIADSNLLFDILDPEDIRRCLNIIAKMSEEERIKIITKQRKYFKEHNTEQVFYNNLMNVIDFKGNN